MKTESTPNTSSRTSTARAGTSSTPARRSPSCTSRSAPQCHPSTPASRSWSTPAAASSASSAAPPSAPRPEQPVSARAPAMGSQRRRGLRQRTPTRCACPTAALVAKRDAPVGGQAVLEGVMMRGVSTWAVAGPQPRRAQIEVTSEPIVSWAKRHRILRLPVIRGVVALGESLKIGFRALAISANAQLEPTRRKSRGDRRLHLGPDDRLLAGCSRSASSSSSRSALTSLIKDQLGSAAPLLAGRGGPADGDLHRLHRRDQPPARPAARLRVPRRRAQDDLLLRGRRRARPGAGQALLAPASRAAAPASC